MRVFRDRPTAVQHEGWTVHVSVRDAYHVAERRRWLERVKVSHPDRGGTEEAFLSEWSRYLLWRRKERTWYAELGLVPPLEKPTAVASEAAQPGCHRCGAPVRAQAGNKSPARYCSRLCVVEALKGRPRPRRQPIIRVSISPSTRAKDAFGVCAL